MNILDVPAVPERRSHADIVRAIGATELHRRLTGRGIVLTINGVQRWADRDSIPAEYWNALANEGIATLPELATAADARKTAA